MYLGMDGTGVPMRSQEVVDRAGKQADSSAKTREAKLVTIWTAESRDEEGKPVRDPGSITYSAAIESAATRDTSPDLSDFAARVHREASRRGFPQAPRQAVLGDGSTWIWNTTAELFPRATQILDRFHAKEHLSQAGKVIYGDSLEVKSWIRARYDEIDKGYLNPWCTRCVATPLNTKRRGSVFSTFGKSTAHAISRVPQTRFLHFDRRGRGWLQSGDRNPGSSGRPCTGA